MSPDLWIPIDYLKVGNHLLFSPRDEFYNPYILYEGLILNIKLDWKNAPDKEPLLKVPKIFEVEVTLETKKKLIVEQSQVVGLLDYRRVGAAIVPYRKD